MKQPCAFCPNPADSREHIWSDWINKILPNTHFRLTRISDTGVSHRWEKRVLDVAAPVVCQQCNNGWMSDFEEKRAKPAIKDLILADKLVKLSPERLQSIACFGFKTAVVGDHTSVPERAPFFSTAERFAFRESFQIPKGVQMWISAYKEAGHGVLRGFYYKSSADAPHGIEFYVLTFGAGYFLVQVLAAKWVHPSKMAGTVPRFTQGGHWNKYAIPFWPSGTAISIGPEISSSTLSGQIGSASDGRTSTSLRISRSSDPCFRTSNASSSPSRTSN